MKTDRSILLDSSHHIVDSLTGLNSSLSLTRDRSGQRAVPNDRELKTKGYEYLGDPWHEKWRPTLSCLTNLYLPYRHLLLNADL